MRTFIYVMCGKSSKSLSRRGLELFSWESGCAIRFPPQHLAVPVNLSRLSHNTSDIAGRCLHHLFLSVQYFFPMNITRRVFVDLDTQQSHDNVCLRTAFYYWYFFFYNFFFFFKVYFLGNFIKAIESWIYPLSFLTLFSYFPVFVFLILFPNHIIKCIFQTSTDFF